MASRNVTATELEELKAENERIRQENEELKAERRFEQHVRRKVEEGIAAMEARIPTKAEQAAIKARIDHVVKTRAIIRLYIIRAIEPARIFAALEAAVSAQKLLPRNSN